MAYDDPPPPPPELIYGKARAAELNEQASIMMLVLLVVLLPIGLLVLYWKLIRGVPSGKLVLWSMGAMVTTFILVAVSPLVGSLTIRGVIGLLFTLTLLLGPLTIILAIGKALFVSTPIVSTPSKPSRPQGGSEAGLRSAWRYEHLVFGRSQYDDMFGTPVIQSKAVARPAPTNRGSSEPDEAAARAVWRHEHFLFGRSRYDDRFGTPSIPKRS